MITFTEWLKNAIVVIFCLIALAGYAQQWQWAEELYFPPTYNSYYNAWNTIPKAIIEDKNGNTYVTGYQTLVIDQQTFIEKRFLIIAKFGQGHLLWKKIFGGLPDDFNSLGTGIATDPAGNIYVTGYFSETLQLGPFQLQSTGEYDIFLAKFTPEGLLVWWKKAGGSGHDYALDITLDAQGNIFLTGFVSGTVNFGNTSSTSFSSDFFVAKYDASGTPQWVKRGGTENGWSKGTKIQSDNNGSISVLGQFDKDVTLENTSLSAESSWSEYFVAKFTDSGNLLWVEKFWGSQPLEAVNLSTDLSGNTIVTGNFNTDVVIGVSTLHTYNGYTDAFIAKFSTIGNVLWARQSGSPNTFAHYGSRSMSTDAEGNSYITGYRLPQNASNEDLWIRKYNAGGWVVWTKINQFAYNAGKAYSRVIHTDDDGNSYVTGNLAGTVTLDDLVISNAEYYDRAFVAKLLCTDCKDGTYSAGALNLQKLNEAIVCFPCFPYDPVQDYEYRFWPEKEGVSRAIHRKVSDPSNRDEIIWKGDRLEITLHDDLPVGTHYFQLRAIAEDGAVSDWTEPLAFEAAGEKNSTLVYPNPVKDQVIIEYHAAMDETILFTLYNRYGSLLLKHQEAVKEGKNILELKIPVVKTDTNPLTLQLQSKLQGTSVWQLIKE